MKIIRISIVFLCFGLLQVLLPHSGVAADLPHHDLWIELDPKKHELKGVDILTLSGAEAEPVRLRLNPGTQILGVTANDKAATYRFEREILTVTLPPPPSAKISLEIRYSAIFKDLIPQKPVSHEDPGYGVGAHISTNGVFLLAEAGWYPHLIGGPATFRVRVETPPGMAAVTSGKRLEQGENFSVWDVSYPLRGLTLSAASFEIREADADGIPVYTYFLPENAGLSDTYLRAAVDYLELYVSLFGPYPFSKFAVVENFFPTGYGFPSWTLIGSTVLRLPFIVKTSLGHEIAHSWWGNGVWIDYERGNWSEGLTTYVADYLYKERESVEEAREYRRKILRDYATLAPPEKDFPLEKFISRTTSAEQAVGYGKSAMVFHMARRRVGDENFWAGLRKIAQEKLFQRASWNDFARALGETGNQDLSEFFRQWINRPGAPILELEQIHLSENGDWRISGRVIQKSPPYFDLRLPLLAESSSEKKMDLLRVEDDGKDINLTINTRPARLMLDPDADVFRRLSPEEIPPIVNSIRGSTSLLVIRGPGFSERDWTEAGRTLIEALGQSDAQVLQALDADASKLNGKDLLYLGYPGPEQVPDTPASLSLESRKFTLNGKTYRSADATLFAALPHPVDENRAAALFLPFSPAAGGEAARKIPHYGKYSYLVFLSGRNVAKGVWETAGGPTVYSFGTSQED